MTNRYFRIFVVFMILCGLNVAIPPKIVRASTLVVTKIADTNDGVCNADCSLREALTAAGNNDTIDATGISGTMTLSSVLLVTKSVTINGPGTASLTITGSDLFRVFQVNSSITVSINDMTITHGKCTDCFGGAVINYGDLTLDNVVISNSKAEYSAGFPRGGGVASDGGTLTITDSTMTQNASELGGAIAVVNSANLNITNTTIDNNDALMNIFYGQGGGISISGGTSILNNVVLSNNEGNEGGGIYIYNGTLNILNSTFSNNIVLDDGGGLYTYNSTTNITSSTFKGNKANGVSNSEGGAIVNLGSMGTGVLNVSNSTLSGNTANAGVGGAIYNQASGGSASYSAITTIKNSTIVENSAQDSLNGGGIFASTASGSETSNINVMNSIIYGNSITSGINGENCSQQNNATIITNNNNLFQKLPNDCTAGTTDITSNVALAFILNSLANNGGPTQTRALVANSLAMDTGSNTICTASPISNTDQQGEIRPYGDACDIGAFEYHSTKIIYVKSNAAGANNGTSWANAYTSLQSALTSAVNGDEIWVAAGTYYPTSGTDQSLSFNLITGVLIYGGFNGTESIRSQRNFSTNIVTLSGDLNEDDGANFTNNIDNSYHVVRSNDVSSAILDGFTITAGNAVGLPADAAGGGIMISSDNSGSGNAAFKNLIITGNAAWLGGGVYNYLGRPLIENSTISNNTATTFSGGGYYISGGIPVISNTTFSGNTAPSGGGAIYINSGNPTITNSTFNNNTSSTSGGAFYIFDGISTITNVTISGNTANTASGGGIFNTSDFPPIITNSILWSDSGGEIINDTGSTTTVSYSVVQGGYSGTGNINSNPLLGVLANNGGTTRTMSLPSGSPAVDSGDNIYCPKKDQRGQPRPSGSQCDIGAYEFSFLKIFLPLILR